MSKSIEGAECFLFLWEHVLHLHACCAGLAVFHQPLGHREHGAGVPSSGSHHESLAGGAGPLIYSGPEGRGNSRFGEQSLTTEGLSGAERVRRRGECVCVCVRRSCFIELLIDEWKSQTCVSRQKSVTRSRTHTHTQAACVRLHWNRTSRCHVRVYAYVSVDMYVEL